MKIKFIGNIFIIKIKNFNFVKNKDNMSVFTFFSDCFNNSADDDDPDNNDVQ